MTTTLLAVDDSKTLRKVLEITFAGEDYKVVLADSSQQALELARAERPTVALVDANLGNESGYDLCQALKREAPGTGVIILSSKHHPYDKARGASVGADDFMDKPFDTQQLIDKTSAVARKAKDAPAAAGAPPPSATPYRAPAPAAPPEPAPPPAAPLAAKAERSPTLAFGTPAPPPAQTTSRASAPVVAPPPARAPASPPMPPAAPAAQQASAAIATATSGNGALANRLADMGLNPDQVDGVLALSREVVEQVVWEVVPQLAETLIKEEIRRLMTE